MDKLPTSFRLTEKAVALLARIAVEQGISQSAVLEMLIRDDAQKKGITTQEPD
jgi:hypothetical protein